VDGFLADGTWTTNYRYARILIRLLYCHNLGSDPGIDGDGERISHVTPPNLEKGGWEALNKMRGRKKLAKYWV